MDLRLSTWNGISINSSNLNSYFPPGVKTNLSSNPVTQNRAGDFPFLSTTVLQSYSLVIGVIIQPNSNINTYREIIKQYFNITDRQRHNLVATDAANSNTPYYVTGFVVAVRHHAQEENHFDVTFQLEYPYWRLVTATVDSWDITATGDSDIVTNSGNINVPPLITITPTTTKTAGYKYRRYVPIYNVKDFTYIAPMDISNGGIDVQTLIDANKIQADGDDLRVWSDGSEIDRWLYGMDSDSDPAQVWANISLSSRKQGTILSTFDSGSSTLYVTQNKSNLKFLQNMKVVANKTLLIENEAVTFTDSDISTLDYTISNVQRGQKDTTAASHAASTTIRHIEHDLWLLYGDSDATAPDLDSDFMPILDLNSTNGIWKYTANFWDNTAERPGEWQDELQSSKSGLSRLYTADVGGYVNPSTKLGISMQGPDDFKIANESATLDWLFYHPAGVTNVKYSGDYRTVDSDNSWPAIVGLQYARPDGTWILAYDDTNFPPASSDSWVAFDSYDIALGGTYNSIRFVMDGQLNSVSGANAQWQADNVYLTFDSDNLPVVSVGAEAGINFFDLTLTNNTTGEYIKVKTPCELNKALTIDCENKKAYLSDGTRVQVILSSDRQEWLDLTPGANNLQYDDVGTVAVTVNITHRDRVL